MNETKEVATRIVTELRYDLLLPTFLKAMAKIANHGAKKYGDTTYQNGRLIGERGPINHIYQHLDKYRSLINYDHDDVGIDVKYHLAAIAFNAMMEWYHCEVEETISK